ncbi:MAG: transglutaminase-like domain-containing protein [Myxococcota bacterium]
MSSNDIFETESIALCISRQLRPEVNLSECVAALDSLSAPLVGFVNKEQTPKYQAELIRDLLYRENGYSGNESDYYDPMNSFLDVVVERKRGIPITLCLIYMSVGARLGMNVAGIGFPGHFLAQVGGPDGVFIDPFNQGKVLTSQDVTELFRDVMGFTGRVPSTFLKPVGAQAVAVRILANLKNAYSRRGDQARAMVACDKLVELTGMPEHRRDRGLLALTLGSYHSAREDLQAYLQAKPDAKDLEKIRKAVQRAHNLSSSAILN